MGEKLDKAAIGKFLASEDNLFFLGGRSTEQREHKFGAFTLVVNPEYHEAEDLWNLTVTITVKRRGKVSTATNLDYFYLVGENHMRHLRSATIRNGSATLSGITQDTIIKILGHPSDSDRINDEFQDFLNKWMSSRQLGKDGNLRLTLYPGILFGAYIHYDTQEREMTVDLTLYPGSDFLFRELRFESTSIHRRGALSTTTQRNFTWTFKNIDPDGQFFFK